ncbi:MAG TPA: hypothetical protein VLW53_24655 [Candidatus Eisenbacteria bacterium]|nr:hypothetical protein [Candidatus Eisenbacteria bacterium]
MAQQDVQSNLQRGTTPPEPSTGWTGWVIFAGIMMIVIGTFNALDGLVALLSSDYFAAEKDLLISNFTAWGWLMLVFGVLVLFAGFGVLAGQTWARVVGVLLAVLNAVAHVAFLAAFPVWSTLVIGLDVVLIYALTAHGRELGQP